MANESEWPTLARHFPLRYLRCAMQSREGARREKKMVGAQGRRQGLPRPARNGAHARDSSSHAKLSPFKGFPSRAEAGSDLRINLHLKALFPTNPVRTGSHSGRVRIIVR